jgi:hypothetical protein
MIQTKQQPQIEQSNITNIETNESNIDNKIAFNLFLTTLNKLNMKDDEFNEFANQKWINLSNENRNYFINKSQQINFDGNKSLKPEKSNSKLKDLEGAEDQIEVISSPYSFFLRTLNKEKMSLDKFHQMALDRWNSLSAENQKIFKQKYIDFKKKESILFGSEELKEEEAEKEEKSDNDIDDNINHESTSETPYSLFLRTLNKGNLTSTEFNRISIQKWNDLNENNKNVFLI